MIKIYDYYERNVNKNDFYYYTFNKEIELYFTFNEDFSYFDEEAIMSRFKMLTYPANELPEHECIEFIAIAFYLHNEGYYIDLFPNFLNRPTGVNDFSLTIRKYIIKQEGSYGVPVPWESRRTLADSMKF